MIIGLCGAAGAGKNSVADVLSERYGFRQLAFADPIYEAVAAITGMAVAELQDREQKERPLGWLPCSPRRLLQSLGTEWGRELIHPDIWITAAMRRIEEGRDYCVTDVRFVNEAHAIRDRGGVIWKVWSPRGSSLSPEAARHASEGGIPDFLVSSAIANTGTLEDLSAAVGAVMDRVDAGSYRHHADIM